MLIILDPTATKAGSRAVDVSTKSLAQREDFEILNFYPKSTIEKLWQTSEADNEPLSKSFEEKNPHTIPSAEPLSDSSPQSKMSESIKLTIATPIPAEDEISNDGSPGVFTEDIQFQSQSTCQLTKRSVLPQTINSQFTDVLIEAREALNEKSLELIDSQLALAKFQINSRLLKTEEEKKQFQLRFDAEQERFKRERHDYLVGEARKRREAIQKEKAYQVFTLKFSLWFVSSYLQNPFPP